MPRPSPHDLFRNFRESLGGADCIAGQVIGDDAEIDGPFGRRPLIYADYVASGRALFPVERFVLENVLPFYANSHTEASYCGAAMTTMRREARAVVAEACGADERHAVIFTGSGATSGINRLVHLLGLGQRGVADEPPLVILGPYEHHSNILPWRESGAEVLEIGESADGGPDPAELKAILAGNAGRRVVCSFSAASNVTGIIADVGGLTAIAKAAGARIVWDYAGGGPYLPITMSPAPDAEIDAIVVSPHKFIGGPGSSGVLIVRRDAVAVSRPTWPGGGTVRFVSPDAHDYTTSLEAREEAGTPNVIGDIRAALAFLVKEAMGRETLDLRNDALAERALSAWSKVDRLVLLGRVEPKRLPIFSFRIGHGEGGFLHQQFVTRLLSDRYGIQARGGCACAGPYALRLLDLPREEWPALHQAIGRGDELAKPGFTRLNFSVLLPEHKVRTILEAVAEIASDAQRYAALYEADRARAIFTPIGSTTRKAVRGLSPAA